MNTVQPFLLRPLMAKFLCVVCLSCLCSLSTGCSSITGMGLKSNEPIEGLDTRAMRAAGYNFDERGAQKAYDATTKDGRPSVVLEVRDGKKHVERIPLSADKPTFVQDIVEDAKLYDRLGAINVTILRPTGGMNPPIRMEADFDHNTKGIVKWQNYALQPGDQIVVSRDNRSWLDTVSANIIPGARSK